MTNTELRPYLKFGNGYKVELHDFKGLLIERIKCKVGHIDHWVGTIGEAANAKLITTRVTSENCTDLISLYKLINNPLWFVSTRFYQGFNSELKSMNHISPAKDLWESNLKV